MIIFIGSLFMRPHASKELLKFMFFESKTDILLESNYLKDHFLTLQIDAEKN